MEFWGGEGAVFGWRVAFEGDGEGVEWDLGRWGLVLVFWYFLDELFDCGDEFCSFGGRVVPALYGNGIWLVCLGGLTCRFFYNQSINISDSLDSYQGRPCVSISADLCARTYHSPSLVPILPSITRVSLQHVRLRIHFRV